MIMIYPLIAIIVYLLLCYASDTGPFSRRSRKLRDLAWEWQNSWQYIPLEDIPVIVDALKKETGLPVRLVLTWKESGSLRSRIYPKLDIEDVEEALRYHMKNGRTITETKVRVFEHDKGLPPPPGLVKAPSHICVSMGFDEGEKPIDEKATVDVIKWIFGDYGEKEVK